MTTYSPEYAPLAQKFKSGNDHIDNHIKGSRATDKCSGTTMVFLNKEKTEIIGFFSLSAGAVEREYNGSIVRSGGSIHINDFAIDTKYQGEILSENPLCKFSDILFQKCLDYIRQIRDEVLGVAFVTLEATKQGHNLYQRNGFEQPDDDESFAGEEDSGNCIPMYYAFDWDNV